MSFDRIVVGVDGSENSAAAVTWVAEHAGVTTEVIAVHALGLLDRVETETPVPTQPHREEIREKFEHTWCAPLERANVRPRRVIRDGNPVDVLLAVGDEEDADVVVVGSRGLGGYPELLLGSTSTQVAQLATRPVVIVPSRHDH